MKKCIGCDKEFSISKFHPKQRFCSKVCYKKRWHKERHNSQEISPTTCISCGNIFIPSIFHPKAATCSKKCSKKAEYRKNKVKRIEKVIEWQKNNRERVNLYHRINYSRNKEKFAERKKHRRSSLFSQKEWKKFCEERNFKCQLCTKILTFKECTLDHIVPVSLGGLDVLENYQLSCQDCNRKKSNKVS